MKYVPLNIQTMNTSYPCNSLSQFKSTNETSCILNQPIKMTIWMYSAPMNLLINQKTVDVISLAYIKCGKNERKPF